MSISSGSQKLTVVYRDAGALVWCEYVTTAAATYEAARCVHTFMVAHAASGGHTLIDVCRFLVQKIKQVEEAAAGQDRDDVTSSDI